MITTNPNRLPGWPRMFGKILLTLVVIGTAFIILRQRSLTEQRAKRRQDVAQAADTSPAPADDNFDKDLRLGAYLFLVLMVGLGASLYYFQWQDNHQILTVTLYRDNQIEPVRYEVYKYQLGDRSFTTVDGTAVTVASSERMVVLGLEN
jgi:hypothetical protein